MYLVELNPVRKSLKRVPYFIRDKVQIWANMVEKEGLPSVQMVKGFRDHMLKGKRKNQRSVYLNKKYRLIYEVDMVGNDIIITVKEVIPHAY